MSQADSPDSLSRLKVTIAQLQEVLTTLEQEGGDLPGTALDQLATDAALLVQALQAPVTQTIPEAIAPAATDDWIDGEEKQQPTPAQRPISPTKSTKQVAPRAVRRRQKPWWQQQKVLIGAVGAAIAFIFVWQLATKSPETTLEANNPATETPTEIVETSEPVTPVEPSPEPTTVTTPVIPQPTVEIKPAPEPPRPLTPEQRLIAAIQAQVNDVTQPYGDNIVRSIEADFEQGTLRIIVGDAWYLLKEKLQDRLGTDVLRLAQKLDFTKMRVEDLQGNFVARNPVVGDALVIMKRYQDFAPEE
jgi:hypothetical protein